jgi:hypothetical protein
VKPVPAVAFAGDAFFVTGAFFAAVAIGSPN